MTMDQEMVVENVAGLQTVPNTVELLALEAAGRQTDTLVVIADAGGGTDP